MPSLRRFRSSDSQPNSSLSSSSSSNTSPTTTYFYKRPSTKESVIPNGVHFKEVQDQSPKSIMSRNGNNSNGNGNYQQARVIPVQMQRSMQRKTSIEEVGERVVGMLDEIERRVEHLRENANSMEQEKEQLMEMLGTMMMNKDMLKLGEGERSDMEVTMNRLYSRCRTVDVQVNTPRNTEQQTALVSINTKIEELIHKMEDDIGRSKDVCKRWLSTCDPEQDGPIDQKFQNVLIECTADDQKKIRRRLATLNNQIERALKSVQPNI